MLVARLTVVVLLGFMSLSTTADKREVSARKALAGTSGKTWVRVAMKIFLGPEKKCTQGETWLFRPDGHVRLDRCIDGKLVTKDNQWHLHTLDALDVGLTVGDDEFVVLMPEIGNGTKVGTMVLRRRSNTKIVPTEDIEFRYEKD